ncbi:MAG: hypothetical protein ONB27_02615 [candidate division KSB1 bacterium]|nr:hypothetical protein [candidate division KSB1 bacterium]
MKKTLTLLIVSLFALPLLAQNSIWFNGSFDEAMATAAKEGKMILIDFYSAG